jgi:hypothetical protein
MATRIPERRVPFVHSLSVDDLLKGLMALCVGTFLPFQDSSRLHYEPWELRLFENIESQWPLFFCYLFINAYFDGDPETANRYSRALNDLMVIDPKDGTAWLPEIYSVTKDNMALEEVWLFKFIFVVRFGP